MFDVMLSSLAFHCVRDFGQPAGNIGSWLKSGFAIERVVEPPPPEDMLDLPGMRDELWRPMMLLAAARKV